MNAYDIASIAITAISAATALILIRRVRAPKPILVTTSRRDDGKIIVRIEDGDYATTTIADDANHAAAIICAAVPDDTKPQQ